MKQIILGTAGHIDHGKTALIKALTGVDTDRLKEEKRRGISVELGFASLSLPGGAHLGIVDVPGHEKFIKNMLAGASGIDIVALIIAADEGAMPQTREHLDICHLLGIKAGLVVLTKIDLVDKGWLEFVKEDIGEFIQGSFLEKSPIIPVSSVTEEGLPQLLDVLDQLVKTVEEKSSMGPFRLPIDRVFTMKGFGTVVTGTSISGGISVGDTAEILPEKIESKVRGIQVHNQSVERVAAGFRTAINLQGLEKSAIRRGDVLTIPKTLRPSFMLDAELECLSSINNPIKNRLKVRFHTGTSEIFGRVILLEGDELKPGERALAQLRLEAPVVTLPQDRFVIRSYSPLHTIGGGIIINPHPKKHRRSSPDVLSNLRVIQKGKEEEVIKAYLFDAGYEGLYLNELKTRIKLPLTQLSDLLQKLTLKNQAIYYDRDNLKLIHGEKFSQLKKIFTSQLRDYHQKFPLKSGIPKEELRRKLPQIGENRLFDQIVSDLVKSHEVILEKDKLRASSHRITLEKEESKLQKKIEGIYLMNKLQPPSFKEVVERLRVSDSEIRAIFDLLITEGILIKIKEGLYFHRDALETLKEKLVEFLNKNGEITTPRFKEMTEVSRKYTIPLIEYFDKTKLTIRVGEKRTLR
jgi:selenocysteine-specific elongation factor